MAEVGRDYVKAQGEGAVMVHTQDPLVPTQPSTLMRGNGVSTAHTILEDSETLFSPSFTHLQYTNQIPTVKEVAQP